VKLEGELSAELSHHLTPRPSIMSEGALFKPAKDFTKEADKIIPEAQEIAKVCDLPFPAAGYRSLLLRQMSKEE
jgi:hypothetical protein